jgi:4-hydroxybenzoate polyprenyltransferase
MRPHRWIKNLLAFVPIFAAGALTDWPAWEGGVLAFVALCAVTSSMYLVNDLIDLSADREHARKRHRALASGKASLPAGIALAAFLLLIGALFGWACGIPHVLVGYVAVSLAYSLWLKRQPLLDVFALSGLYTLRLVGGGEATGHRLSLWLLASAGFLFLSLALIKRVAEVMDRSARATDAAPRTDYGLDDLMILELFGVCATFASSLVLALYVQYQLTDDSFASPGLLWCTVPLVLLWNCRMWLATARGNMHHDPTMYAARDWVTWGVAAALIFVVLAARTGLPLH